jgi:fatty-acid desaturase
MDAPVLGSSEGVTVIEKAPACRAPVANPQTRKASRRRGASSGSRQLVVPAAEEYLLKKPWLGPWWRAAPGEWPVLGWMVLIHVTAIVGLILFPLPGWPLFLSALALAWFGGIGTTVCYHRTIAHRALKLNPLVRHVLTFFAMINGSGTPTTWAANHRLHHAAADTEEDISSPRIGGFWWAHLRWLWQAGQASQARFCRDLGSPSYAFWSRLQVPILALSFFGGLALGWKAFFWLGAIRLVYVLHGQCFVNSVCHLHPHPKDGEDTSKNLVWLGIVHLFQGENWHRNHHKNAYCARLGLRWWQIDMGWWVILALEKLRLAKDVKRPMAGRSAA